MGCFDLPTVSSAPRPRMLLDWIVNTPSQLVIGYHWLAFLNQVRKSLLSTRFLNENFVKREKKNLKIYFLYMFQNITHYLWQKNYTFGKEGGEGDGLHVALQDRVTFSMSNITWIAMPTSKLSFLKQNCFQYNLYWAKDYWCHTWLLLMRSVYSLLYENLLKAWAKQFIENSFSYMKI